jgi:hypothetical protein
MKQACCDPEFAKEMENQCKMRSYEIKCDTEHYASNFTPDLVISVIKKYI